MSYHNKLTEVTHKLNTLKIRVTIILIFIVLIWIFSVNLSTTIWLTIALGCWSTISIIDIIKIKKLVEKYRKLAKKEDDEVKENLNNIFNNNHRTYYQRRPSPSQKELDDLLNELLNKMLNEQFKQQYEQQHHQQQHQVNVDKLSNAYKLLRLNRNDSIEKIKKTYKILTMKWHPDKWSTSTEQNKSTALRNFKKLQSAYDIIKKDKNIV